MLIVKSMFTCDYFNVKQVIGRKWHRHLADVRNWSETDVHGRDARATQKRALLCEQRPFGKTPLVVGNLFLIWQLSGILSLQEG